VPCLPPSPRTASRLGTFLAFLPAAADARFMRHASLAIWSQRSEAISVEGWTVVAARRHREQPPRGRRRHHLVEGIEGQARAVAADLALPRLRTVFSGA